MKILNVSLDQKVLENNSAVQQRILEYGKLVEQYTVVVLGKENSVLDLSSKVKIISLKKCNKVLDLIKLKLMIWKLLKNKKFDLISVQDPYFIGLLAWQMAKLFKVGLEIQVHGFEKLNGIRKVIAKYILPRANAVRVVSQRLKKQLIEDFKVKEDRITVVPVYVEIGERRKEKGERSDNKFIFLTIGRLVPVKNIQMQIEAVNDLKEKYPNIELWIIGDGPERKDYELRITNYGLQDRIKLFGYQKNLEKFYQQADVFLLTSNSEGWPLVIMEAINYNLPIIMTDVGSAGELIINQKSGLVIPIADQQALLEAMTRLIQNNNLRFNLANNAYEIFKNISNKEKNLKLYYESWQKAIE